jgi:selenide,water dikinase
VGALARVLGRLPPSAHPDLLVGTAHFADAGVFRLREDLALVLTTDFFPPLVDDPRTFGRIAAANSLSDCYAMGGKPVTALNIVGFPDDQLPIDILGDIMAGGAEIVAEAGAVIVGGHSVRDAEIKYGLAVTGTIDPRRLITNTGARPGDVLVLTKPIGSGVLTSAAKMKKIPESDLAEAIEVMTRLNRVAGEALFDHGAHAATDITGFGLVGHAFEMASASNVTIEINAGAVPLLTGALDLAKRGCLTRAWKSTLDYLGDRVNTDGVDESLRNVLADAQTSGGLLVALPPDRADGYLEAVRAANAETAAIGTVVSRNSISVKLTA